MLESLLLQAALLSTHGHVTAPATNPAPLIQREEFTVTFGPEPFEEYKVAHVSAPWATWPLILVVPLGSPSSWYEATADYHDSLAAAVAYLGIDLYIQEQRRGTSATLPTGSCPGPFGPGTVDCSAFGEWSVDDIIEDIAYTRDVLVSTTHKASVGGQWTGAMAAQAAVNAEPDEYASLIMWEGTMYAEDLATLGKNAAVCGSLGSLPDAAGASSAPGDETFASFLAQVDPTGLSPFPQVLLDQFFLTAGVATNLEVLYAVFIVDNFPVLLDRVAKGLVFMVGTVEDGPDVADITQVFNITNTVPQSTYAPLGVLEDYACGLGGSMLHTGDLDTFEGAVLVIGSDRGMRTELEDTADLFTSASFVHTDYRGEFGVHDLLWSDLMKPVALEIALFTIGAHH